MYASLWHAAQTIMLTAKAMGCDTSPMDGLILRQWES